MKSSRHTPPRLPFDRLLGAACIVSGTTIGAAMLALPISMGRAGFFPSLIALFASWLFMLYPAFLFLELCTSFKHGTNVISLASETLGKWGAFVASSAYVLLLFSLLTAYIAALSQVVTSTLGSVAKTAIPQEVITLFLFLTVFILFTRGVRFVDNINRIMMMGLLVSFLFLVVSSRGHLHTENLFTARWQYVLPSLSIGFTSFGFHVVIPSMAKYLEYDSRRLVRVLLVGTLLPLIGYILWQGVCLAQLPMSGSPLSIDGAFSSGMSASELLAQLYPRSLFRIFSDSFAITAIITSFLGVSLSMVDFLRDGLARLPALHSRPKRARYLALLLSFLPPMYFASTSPQVFYTALRIAGVFGVVLLLAFLPACMVYQNRYGAPRWLQGLCAQDEEHHRPKSVDYRAFGGKRFLGSYILLALLIVVLELLSVLQLVKIGS